MDPEILSMINMHMISKVFVDTNVYVALRDRLDSTHQNAVSILKSILNKGVTMYTSSDVIGESLTVISRKTGKIKAKDFLTEVQKMANVIFVDEITHKETQKYFFRVKSKNISFIDCSNVITMKRNKIKYIFSFDEDFRTLGVKLLSDMVN